MPRPREFENLGTTCVSANRDMIEDAKEMGINLSELFRDALAVALKKPEYRKKAKIKDKFKHVPRRMLHSMENIVGRDPTKAENWAAIINQKCAIIASGPISVTPADIRGYVCMK